MSSTPPDLTTELSAVNTLLAGVGEQQVESLDAIESSLVQTALNALREASRTVQVKSWYWNYETDYPLTVNASNNIPLPVGTMKVHEVRGSNNDDLIQRGQRLYNRTEHTYVFDASVTVKVDITFMLAWEDLPEFAKHPILYLAQKRFQMRELTSTAINAAIKEDVEYAITLVEQAEDQQGPANILQENPGLVTPGYVRRRP